MRISINDETVIVNDGKHLNEILDSRGFKDREGIAVAVNEEVISKNEWNKVALNEDDKVLIISATQGG